MSFDDVYEGCVIQDFIGSNSLPVSYRVFELPKSAVVFKRAVWSEPGFNPDEPRDGWDTHDLAIGEADTRVTTGKALAAAVVAVIYPSGPCKYDTREPRPQVVVTYIARCGAWLHTDGPSLPGADTLRHAFLAPPNSPPACHFNPNPDAPDYEPTPESPPPPYDA